ncbi:hypothetical protein Tco_0679598, partial [Tanacetum coccineum]
VSLDSWLRRRIWMSTIAMERPIIKHAYCIGEDERVEGIDLEQPQVLSWKERIVITYKRRCPVFKLGCGDGFTMVEKVFYLLIVAAYLMTTHEITLDVRNDSVVVHSVKPAYGADMEDPRLILLAKG